MTTTESRPTAPAPERRSGELNLRELARWSWRQLTSMRIALILLLLLALAAVPGSLVPQERVDALKAGQWKDQHETLAPIYEKLGVFNVYGSPWFAAIYILLVVSLVGCIVPRTFVYARGLRAQPPAAPRNLTRLPHHASYSTQEPPEVVLERARALLKRKRYRLREDSDGASVSAERGYLREVGNLVFHLAVLVVLVGFALGSLLGYKGGVILVTGSPFSNTPTQYDDFVPGSLFRASQLDPFTFTGQQVRHRVAAVRSAGGHGARLQRRPRLHAEPGRGRPRRYDLRVNHPLTIGDTDLFLIGHGYAPVVTIKDGQGRTIYDRLPGGLPAAGAGPVLLRRDQGGGRQARPARVRGLLLPDVRQRQRQPGQPQRRRHQPAALAQRVDRRPRPRLRRGAVGLRARQEPGRAAAGQAAGMETLRVDLAPGDTVELPDGLGSITFDRVESWQRIQISQTPGKGIALLGVILALLGLMGSLFIRSRRVWLRVSAAGGGTLVEVAALDRSGGADTDAVLSRLLSELQEGPDD